MLRDHQGARRAPPRSAIPRCDCFRWLNLVSCRELNGALHRFVDEDLRSRDQTASVTRPRATWPRDIEQRFAHPGPDDITLPTRGSSVQHTAISPACTRAGASAYP